MNPGNLFSGFGCLQNLSNRPVSTFSGLIQISQVRDELQRDQPSTMFDMDSRRGIGDRGRTADHKQ
jgi:hypothetical protein